jgi:hypothetical protein
MAKEAVLLKPGGRVEGSLELDPAVFGLPPGTYRIKATLACWKDDEFTCAERKQLEKLGGRFLRGEVTASSRIVLTP